MKTGFYSAFYGIISIGAIAFCFLPFLFLRWKEIRRYPCFWLLGIYWFLNGFDNLLEAYFSSGPGNGHHLVRQFSYCFSLIEAPLVLLVYALARRGRGRKLLIAFLITFITCEALLIRRSGSHFLLLILASGLAAVILFSLTGLWDYLKKMEHSRFENSMAFVYGALLFSYGSMLIVYVFAHFHHLIGTGDTDSFLLYYVSLLLSAAVTCTGLWSYGVRKPRGRSWSPSSGYSSSSS